MHRPSGATVLLNCAVKVLPTEEDAIAVKKRHDSLKGQALDVIHRDGCSLVFPMASLDVSTEEFFEALERLHNTDTGMHGTSLAEYLKYVLRDPSLPSMFRDAVLSRRDAVCTAVLTVHGDCNLTNIVRFNGTPRWIDLSIRPEPLFKELDESKYYFRELRDNGAPNFNLTDGHQLFLATHFCRVWTRETDLERKKLERMHHEHFNSRI